MGGHFKVNGLQLPSLLVSLMEAGRWVHPGDSVIGAAIPFLHGPVDFLDLNVFRGKSFPMFVDRRLGDTFREARGHRLGKRVELPWLDAARAVYIAVSRHDGDDLTVALDYRSDPEDPRVVATEWVGGCEWRVVSNSFTEFAWSLGLITDDDLVVAPDTAGM
jgi:hypothetical protein